MSSKEDNNKDSSLKGNGKGEELDMEESRKEKYSCSKENKEKSSESDDKNNSQSSDKNNESKEKEIKPDEVKSTEITAKNSIVEKKTEQTLDVHGNRERKKVEKVNDDPADAKDAAKIDIPKGKGIPLGDIPRVDASIGRFKNDDLKLLHQLLFNVPGKTTIIKKNIKKFNGFDFVKESDDYNKKLSLTLKFEVKQLKIICEMLDLDKKGTKDDITERIIDFLIDPKDSGKVDGGGRPKRTAAVKANNRGYSSHDESYSSDEKRSPRSRRGKGKRLNLKDESSSESDEEFRLSDASEEKPQSKRKTTKVKKQRSEEEPSDAEESLESNESYESDVEHKTKKRRTSTNKPMRGKSMPGKGRGRKPTSANTASPKRKNPVGRRGRKQSSESNEDDSENEPLIKKTKTTEPPTDEEIKSYVKDILEGANLEEITMKTVCKQVYAHYPDFDLTHKKDYIKTTVKSLIST